MTNRYDAIVLGLGCMGSACAYHLAKQGWDVLGLDRYHPPHPYGSSHGQTRVFRKAYFEGAYYVPWIQEAYDGWLDLEDATGRDILHETGALHLGTLDGTQVSGARHALDTHGLPYQDLTAEEIRAKYPAFAPQDTHEAVYEAEAGFIAIHEAIEGHLEAAQSHGATFAFGTQAWGWREDPTGIRVSTHDGNAYYADELVVALGPWLPKHIPEIDIAFEIERQVQFVIEPSDRLAEHPDKLHPVFTFEPKPGEIFYGVHRPDGRVKLARHHGGEAVDPDEVEGIVTQQDEAPLRRLIQRYAPGLDGSIKESMVCTYTNTPDHDFLLDHHPNEERTLLVSPCSGHGFKFAPAIGQTAASLVRGKEPPLDTSAFRIDRFTTSAPNGPAG